MRQRGPALADSTAVKGELAVEILRSYGVLQFCATGWSMLPGVWSGDVLVVDGVPASQIQIGDIALVVRDGRLCAHRVVRLPGLAGDRYWVTQGDAMPMPDRPVAESELLGRISKIIRSGNRIVVPGRLSLIDRLIAQMVRRAPFAARVFIYLIGKIRSPKESSFPCPV